MTAAKLPGTRLAADGPRTIRQPGPAAAERCTAVPVASMPIAATLPAGARLLDALHALLAEGYDGACLTLEGGRLGPFAYVMPARSPDADHAAYYSATFRPAGETRLETGAVTVGFRDGHPFFHCHAIWTEADGHRGCGHVLPDDTVIAAPVQVRGVGFVGARFEVRPDRETGYSLLTPAATGRAQPPGARPAMALRLAPNQDITAALEHAGARAGFRRACTVVSDGLQRFASVADAGCGHRAINTGSGPAAARVPAFKWVNTALGNIKAAITGTYRAIRAKHVPRYLAEFEYRFNRRYDLAAMIPRLCWAGVRTAPMPYQLLKLAEVYA